MRCDSLPLFDRLADAERVLVAGAGGGYDLFGGLPLAFALEAQGKRVHLVNLTFANPHGAGCRQLADPLFEVTADDAALRYFPERYLCEWFRAQGEERSVYAIERLGAAPVAAAYRALTDALQPDAIVLVDGGTDSLARGDEASLATPEEDIASLGAVAALGDVRTRLLVCIGFGVDAYHGICHAQFLEAVAGLAAEGAFLGAFSLLREMPEVARYLDALAFVHARMPDHPSIVNSSIATALDGEYGDVHRTSRTAGSRLWINPLMALYWAFEAQAVADRCLYLDRVHATVTWHGLSAAIGQFRREIGGGRDYEDIPV